MTGIPETLAPGFRRRSGNRPAPTPTETPAEAPAHAAASEPADAPAPAAFATPPASSETPPPPPRQGSGFFARIFVVSAIPPLLALAAGLPYYLLPLEQRAWSPLDDWFRPSGYIGQSLGFAALALFAFMWLFPFRKRNPWLAFTGSVPRWLDAHIVAGLLLPLIGALHAAWRFNGLIGLGYFAMFVVSLSGVVGRYLYAHIPRRRSGLELSREEVAAERRALIGKLVDRTGIPLDQVLELLQVSQPTARRLGVAGTFRTMVRDDLARRRAARRLVTAWQSALPAGEKPDRRTLRDMRKAARREMSLNQQIRLVDATHRIFRLWHVAHLPVAIVASLAVLIHVLLVIAFGATWLT